jgi:hypothetical protein
MDMAVIDLGPDARRAQKILTRSRSRNTSLQMRARIARDVDAYYEAMKQAATGVTHMMAKDKDGTWKEVTDPAVMARCLNSGESFYRLTARNPDVRALVNLFDRLCGSATQQSQLQVEGQMTLKDLIVASWKSDGDDH